MEEVGNTIRILDKIGKGGFGAVFQCVDENGSRFAVKKIKHDTDGVQCLMEASIMNTIHHPNIHRALKNYVTDEALYLISEEALGDLNFLTKKHGAPSLDVLKIWSYGLVQAVACLHKHQIVHCDIKGANVLLFPNNTVKLTDFTLGTKKWENVKFNHIIGTATHRPPEVWLKKPWDESADIWSLGVTLAEIAMGEYLFPYQEKLKNDKSLENKTINCLLNWGMKGPEGNQNFPNQPDSDMYLPFERKLFSNSSYKKFCSLILPMLRLDPDRRPCIQTYLSHSFFRNAQDEYPVKDSYVISGTAYENISQEKYQFCIKSLRRYDIFKSSVIDLTIDLFSRTQGFKSVSEYSRLVTCLWMASKIILRKEIITDIDTSEILTIERLLCLYLNFKICPPDKVRNLCLKSG